MWADRETTVDAIETICYLLAGVSRPRRIIAWFFRNVKSYSDFFRKKFSGCDAVLIDDPNFAASLLPDDADQIAHLLAAIDQLIFILFIQRVKDVILPVVLQLLDRDGVLERSVKDHRTDLGHLGLVEHAYVIRPD